MKFRVNVLDKVVKTECFSYKLIQTCATFFIVVIAWIFFRANSLKDAFLYINHMCKTLLNASFDLNVLKELGISKIDGAILLAAIFVLFCVDRVRYKRGMRLDVYLSTQNIWYKWGVCIFLFCFILLFGVYGPGTNEQAFIYFQF